MARFIYKFGSFNCRVGDLHIRSCVARALSNWYIVLSINNRFQLSYGMECTPVPWHFCDDNPIGNGPIEWNWYVWHKHPCGFYSIRPEVISSILQRWKSKHRESLSLLVNHNRTLCLQSWKSFWVWIYVILAFVLVPNLRSESAFIRCIS